MQNSEMINFVKSLDIPEYRNLLKFSTNKSDTFEDFKNQITVTPNSISVSTAKITAQQKEDVANARLFAQLVSDKNFNAGRDPMGWYNNYFSILSKLGFIYSNIEMLTYKVSSTDVSVEKSIFEIFAALLEGGELGVLKKGLDVLKKLNEGSSSVSIFNHGESGLDFKNLQISQTDLDENGAPRISLGAFIYSSEKINGTFLFFFNYNISQIKTKTGTTTMSLNTNIYSEAREAIKTKLGNYVTDFVNNIEL